MPETLSTSSAATKQAWLHILDRVQTICLTLSVFLIPLWFLPFTLDVLELNKQTLLVILAMVGLLAWLGQSILRGSFTLSRSWLHLAVLVFVLAQLAASLTSLDRYLSFVGNVGQMQWAFATIMAFAVFYLLVANSIKNVAQVYHLILTFLASSVLAGVIGLLQLVGVYPFKFFFPVSATSAFNTVGNANAFASFLAIGVVLATSLLVLGCKDEGCVLNAKGGKSIAAKGLVWAAIVVGLFAALAVDYWVVWAALLFGTVVVMGISIARTRSVKRSIALLAPALVAVLSIALLIFKTPLKLPVMGEVLPSLSHTWNITTASLMDRPILGSGPGTWIFDYSKFRALTANVSPYWANRFDRGISTLFTLPAMVGVVGLAVWLILVLSALVKSALTLVKERNDMLWQAVLTVFAGWSTVVFLAVFTNYTMSHHFAFWFLFALLAALTTSATFRWDRKTNPMLASGVSIGFLVLAVCAVSVTWLAGQRLVADAKYSEAVLSFQNGKPIQASVDALNSAVALNQLNDAYYRNLSQAYLIQLSQVVQAQDPNKATQADQLTSAAVDTAKRATQLSPANVDNWANLAVIYQSIAPFTRGADEFAIANYREALKREPNNPVFYNEIGKLYIMRSDAYRTLLSSTDAKVKQDAQANAIAELDKAAVELNQAIQVKPDYAPAHYHLGILYERQGRLKDAITKIEQVLAANNQDVGVAFQLSILYERNGDIPRASSILEQIVKLSPNYPNARWYLAAIYNSSGRIDDAIAQLQALTAQLPGNTTVSDQLAQLIKQRDQKKKNGSQALPEPLKEEIKGPAALNPVKK